MKYTIALFFFIIFALTAFDASAQQTKRPIRVEATASQSIGDSLWKDLRISTQTWDYKNLKYYEEIDSISGTNRFSKYKTERNLNSFFKPVSSLSQDFQNDIWTNHEEIIYEYQKDTLLSAKLTKKWIDGLWKDDTKEINEYNAQNMLVKSTHFEWDRDITNSWVTDVIYTYDYDAESRMIKQVSDAVRLPQFRHRETTTYSYDQINRKSEEVTKKETSFIDETPKVVWYTKNVYNYISNTNKTSSMLTYISNDAITWDLNGESKYDWRIEELYDEITSISEIKAGTTKFKIRLNAKIWYEKTPNSVQEVVKIATITLYPNPTTGRFTLHHSETQAGMLYLYDLTGRVIHTQELKDQHTELNIESLPAGIYTLKVQIGSEVQVTKIVKE